MDSIVYGTLEVCGRIEKDEFASLEDEVVWKLVERIRSQEAKNNGVSAWSLSRELCLLSKQTQRDNRRDDYKRTRAQGCCIGYARKRSE
jgi:hypothetical protein